VVPSGPKTARKDNLGVVPTCVDPLSPDDLSAEPTSALKTLIRQRGTYLNRYWHTRGALDFSQVPNSELSESEALGFIKLLRVCVHNLDEAVASGLDPLRILEYLDDDLTGEQGYERRAKKLRYMARVLYGIEHTEEDISRALWQE